MQVKDNQKALHRTLATVCTQATPLSRTCRSEPRRRNRQETRTATVFDAAPALKDTEWAAHAAAIIRVERVTQTFLPTTGLWQARRETALYLSSKPITADCAMQAIRSHWAIENRSHFVRDVTLREDASRIRHKPGLFARLRSFAHNILRYNQNDTIAQDRYALALGGFDAIAQIQLMSEN